MRRAIIWAIIGIIIAVIITVSVVVGVHVSKKKKEAAEEGGSLIATMQEEGDDEKDEEQSELIPEPVKRYFYIEYDATGGQGSMAISKFECGRDNRLAQNNYSRTGYDFIGWATSADGNVYYTNGSMILCDNEGERIRLYAVWSIKTHYTQFFGTQNYTRDKTITTDSKSFSETISPALDRDVLVREGYTKLKVSIDLRLRESNDGYEKVALKDKNGKTLCDKEFEYGAGYREESWGGKTLSWEIPLAKLDSDCQLNVTYSCRGNWFGAAFVLGETTYTIKAIR